MFTTKRRGTCAEGGQDSRIFEVACSPQTKHSCAQDRPNTNSDGQEGHNRHQDEHDQDSTMHEMVVPLGFAVPQLIPRFFVIIHKVIVITSCYAMRATLFSRPRKPYQVSGGHCASSKQVPDTGKLVLLPNISQAFSCLRFHSYRLR
jgi:hypothetical protein